MRWKLFIITLLILISCGKNPTPVKYYAVDNFILEDTCRDANIYYSYDRGYCAYPIYYIGPVTDTIRMGREYSVGRTQLKDHSANYLNRNYAPDNIQIRVDTTVHVNCRLEYFSSWNNALEDSTKNSHAYLLIIKSKSDSILFMGRSFYLYLARREAKNRQGNWVNIEKTIQETAICRTNQPDIFLLPNEMIISKLPRYTGDFKTECRLAFWYDGKIVYSNTFRDAIDEKILISPYVNH